MHTFLGIVKHFEKDSYFLSFQKLDWKMDLFHMDILICHSRKRTGKLIDDGSAPLSAAISYSTLPNGTYTEELKH